MKSSIIKKPVRRIKNGFRQAVISVIIGLLLTWVIDFLVARGTLPAYSATVFGIINIIVNLISINKMKFWGIFYTVGWLAGSILFFNIFSTSDYIFNLIAPILMFAIRLLLWFRSKVLKRI
jgi:hypothetical protein